ncbi:hypothetical protein RQP46_001084 [Phenoliferia psychrophenolica]
MASSPAGSGSGSESDWGDEIEVDDAFESALQQIEQRHSDSTAAATPTPPLRPPPQHIPIALEQPQPQPPPSPKKSLLERFRSRRGLTVTDLVGTLWCEQQHAYRLDARSHLPLALRPTSIQTASGVPIVLDGPRQVHRDAVLDKGTVVHRKLEKEVMGDQEEVKVEVNSKEEHWGLRILNTLVCLMTLLETGKTAEIPCFGYVDGRTLVYGKIDAIERRTRSAPPATLPTPPKKASPASTATTSASPSRGKPATAPDQPRLDQFFSPSPSKGKGKEKAVEVEEEAAKPDWGFVLIDTKTRYNHSLPPKADSRSARLQTMLYHRFLSSLLTRPYPPSASSPPSSSSESTRPTPFPWTTFFLSLSLDPTLPFSPPFLLSIQPILTGSSLEPFLSSATTLDAFVGVLQTFGELLGGNEERGPLDDMLEISYRLRNTVRRKKVNRRKEREEAELRKAIEASLVGIRGGGAGMGDGDEEEEMRRAIEESLRSVEGGKEVEQDAIEEPMLVDDDEDAALADASIPFLVQPHLISPGRLSTFMDIEEDLVPLHDPLDLPPNSQATSSTTPLAIVASSSRHSHSLRRNPSAAPSLYLPSPPSLTSPRPSKRSKSNTPPPPPPPIPTPPPSVPPEAADEEEEDEILEGTLIGTEQFLYDEQELSQHLTSVLQLWRGEREPRGVGEAETGRCRNCEFENGCEWRTRKALEAVERNCANAKARA